MTEWLIIAAVLLGVYWIDKAARWLMAQWYIETFTRRSMEAMEAQDRLRAEAKEAQRIAARNQERTK